MSKQPSGVQKNEPSKVARALKYLNSHRTVLDRIFTVLRNTFPNLSLPGNGPVLVTRFRDVQEALGRPDVFSVPYGPMIDASVGPFMLGRDNTTINERDKGIMLSMMRREDLPFIRETVGRLTQEKLDEFRGGDEIDVVKDLSRWVPIRLTGEYFGFPGPDVETMARWSRAVQMDIFYNVDHDDNIRGENVRAGREMKAYLAGLLAERRQALKHNPGLNDVLSRLLRSRFPEEIGFDDERICANIMGTLIGGVETTSMSVTQILDQLFRRPAALKGAVAAAKSDDDEQLYKYCWEALRFLAQTPFIPRQCVSDYRLASGTLRSRKIKNGKTVLICTASAMKDGREIPAPGQFRIDRPDYHYLHLGYGRHKCLGAHISRVQIPEIVKHLLRLPNVRPAGDLTFSDGPFPETYRILFEARTG